MIRGNLIRKASVISVRSAGTKEETMTQGASDAKATHSDEHGDGDSFGIFVNTTDIFLKKNGSEAVPREAPRDRLIRKRTALITPKPFKKTKTILQTHTSLLSVVSVLSHSASSIYHRFISAKNT